MKQLLQLAVILLSFNAAFAQNASEDLKSATLNIGVIDRITSVELGEIRSLNIYLPEGYSQNTAATYPVIYLLDGSENEDLLHIAGLVQFLTMIEKMPKSIVVGIANVDRKRDFTCPTSIEQDKKDFPTTGSSAKFIRFIENELQPFVEKKYKTNGDKTIIGQSLGGLLATEILLKKTSLFDKYLIVSPSLWWDNESLLKLIPSFDVKKAKVKVYIAVGSEGKQMEADAKLLAEKLTNAGIPSLQSTFHFLPDENHLTILHNAAYKGLESLNKK